MSDFCCPKVTVVASFISPWNFLGVEEYWSGHTPSQGGTFCDLGGIVSVLHGLLHMHYTPPHSFIGYNLILKMERINDRVLLTNTLATWCRHWETGTEGKRRKGWQRDCMGYGMTSFYLTSRETKKLRARCSSWVARVVAWLLKQNPSNHNIQKINHIHHSLLFPHHSSIVTRCSSNTTVFSHNSKNVLHLHFYPQICLRSSDIQREKDYSYNYCYAILCTLDIDY